MDTFLILLTCVSVAAAAIAGVSAWHTLADEARRSALRVAALSAAIDGSELSAPSATPNQPVAVTSMFATAPGAAVSGIPLVKMGIFAALATALVVVVAMANRDHSAPPPAPPAPASALELISMNYTRQGRTLTVSGLVRNPRAGVPREQIDAVVLAFDSRGGFVASGRAALDFTTLAPGDESPFVVKISEVPDVARYRVSFRTAAGILLRHMDRRAADQLQASAD